MVEWRAYEDRTEAGIRLAEALRDVLPDSGEAIVLALPRGGVPVGYEVARELGLPLDLIVVRKLGLPSQPELAMGAIASGGIRVLNDDVVSLANLHAQVIDEVATREEEELGRRERAYRGDRSRPAIAGRTVILVDDGVATGSTILAAIRAVRTEEPDKVVVAVPVSSPEAAAKLRREADLFVCPLVPQVLFAIGPWYDDFPQLTDEDVRTILHRAWGEGEVGAAAQTLSAPHGRRPRGTGHRGRETPRLTKETE